MGAITDFEGAFRRRIPTGRNQAWRFGVFMPDNPGTAASAGKRVMTTGDTNPKIDPAPNSNTEKAPDDWVSGNDPMTGAQTSYLKTLSEECGDPDAFAPDLTKAEASKRIDALKAKRQPARDR